MRINYIKGDVIDEDLKRIVRISKESILDPNNKDDAFYLICGDTGTGKSHLMLHIVSAFTDKPDINLITLSQEKFANSIHIGLTHPKGERFLAFDESKLSAREGMSKWNKDIMDLYFKIRQKGFFNVWNHPSPEYIDKHMIRTRVSGLFLTYEKTKDRPRRYLFYPKKKLIDFLDKHKKLTIASLLTEKERYATHVGCFKKYEGELLKPYEEIKEEGMDIAIDYFTSKWGNKERGLDISKVAKSLQVHPKTAKNVILTLIDEGTLNAKDVKNPTGRFRLLPHHVDMLKERIIKNSINSNLKRGFPI